MKATSKGKATGEIAPPDSPAWSRWFVPRARKHRKVFESDAAALRNLLDKLAGYDLTARRKR